MHKAKIIKTIELKRTTFAQLCTKAEKDIDTATNRSPSSEKNIWVKIEKDHTVTVVASMLTTAVCIE